MTTPLTLDTGRDADGRPVLTAHGEIDLTNCTAFASALAAAVAEGSPVVVDLTEVEYLDSGAINALFTHAEHLRLIVRPVLLPALRICGLTTVASVTTDEHTT
jgi:anti-anti-sigma factor